MPTPITVELQWLSITEGAPTTNFGHFAYAQAYGPQVGCGAALLAAALPSLPADITVTNARIELDYYLYTNWGSGQIKRLHRGMSKTESTWNLLNKTTGKTWLSGGPFLYGTDCTTLFWSGAFTDDDPQVCTGTAALAAYIEGKGESNWVLFAVIGAGSGDNKKDLDGARLKFYYTVEGTPVLTSFSPTSILSGATPVLYVYGSFFDAGSLDKIQLVGGSTYDLTSIVRDSAEQLHGTVPGGVAVGSYTVRARIGGVNYDAPGSFAVSATPELTSFSPASILESETPVLYVYGSALDAGSLDKIPLVGASTYDLTSIVRDSASQLHGTVPGGMAVGSYTVRARIAAVNYDAPGSFVVSATSPTLSNCRGDDGGKDFVKHFMRTVTCLGTYLGGTSSITLLGQEGQDDVSLTSITNVSSTEVSGWLTGPITPGRYQVRVVCTNGTAYRDIDVTLGPAWW